MPSSEQRNENTLSKGTLFAGIIAGITTSTLLSGATRIINTGHQRQLDQ